MQALLPELNRIVLECAPAHTVRDHAPSTFAEMMSAPGIVWSGGSDQTMFADASVNWAFRAWHDKMHAQGLAPFDAEGERRACELQIRDMLARYPRMPQLLADAMRIEVNGQVDYFAAHGAFVQDQLTFTRNQLRGLGYDI